MKVNFSTDNMDLYLEAETPEDDEKLLQFFIKNVPGPDDDRKPHFGMATTKNYLEIKRYPKSNENTK